MRCLEYPQENLFMRIARRLILFPFLAAMTCGLLSAQEFPLEFFAEHGSLPSGTKKVRLWDLASLDAALFPAVFKHSQAPNLREVRGHFFQGMILRVTKWRFGKILFTQYTGGNKDLLKGVLHSRSLTFRKRFFPEDNAVGESGINYWPMKGRESLPMKAAIGPSPRDEGRASLLIDYGVESNPAVTVTPLLDEVRQIPGSQLYLGKMYYRLFGRPIFFLWFALERVAL
jgi:hypothetical protein